MANATQPVRTWAFPFFALWTGQALSLLGSRVAQFALIWWITQSTGSAVVLTTLALVATVPQVVLGPIGGALVDRWNRRLIMLVADSVIALSTALLILLFWSGYLQLWHIYVTTFVGATMGIVHYTAMMTTTSLMVPESHLAQVQGANQMLQGVMSIAAPPLGAFLVAILPLHQILSIDLITAAFAIIPLFLLTIPQPKHSEQREQEPNSSVWAEVRFGLQYIWQWPGLLIVVVGGMVLNMLVNPTFTLLPLLVTDYYQGGAVQLGWLEASWGVGIIVGGLLLSLWGGWQRRIVLIPLGLLVAGCGIATVGLLPAALFSGAVISMGLIGLGLAQTNGVLLAIVQAKVEPTLQGRVFTVLASGTAATSPLGFLLAGPIAEVTGVPLWFVVSGVVTILLGVILFFTPAFMQLEEQQPPPTQPTSAPVPVAVETGA